MYLEIITYPTFSLPTSISLYRSTICVVLKTSPRYSNTERIPWATTLAGGSRISSQRISKFVSRVSKPKYIGNVLKYQNKSRIISFCDTVNLFPFNIKFSSETMKAIEGGSVRIALLFKFNSVRD